MPEGDHTGLPFGDRSMPEWEGAYVAPSKSARTSPEPAISRSRTLWAGAIILMIALTATTTYSVTAMLRLSSEVHSLSAQVRAQDSNGAIAQLRGGLNQLSSRIDDVESTAQSASSATDDLSICVNDFQHAFINYTFGSSGQVTYC